MIEDLKKKTKPTTAAEKVFDFWSFSHGYQIPADPYYKNYFEKKCALELVRKTTKSFK